MTAHNRRRIMLAPRAWRIIRRVPHNNVAKDGLMMMASAVSS